MKKLKAFLLLLALYVSLLFPSYSEESYMITETEIQQIETQLTSLEMQATELKKVREQLETSLKKSEKEKWKTSITVGCVSFSFGCAVGGIIVYKLRR